MIILCYLGQQVATVTKTPNKCTTLTGMNWKFYIGYDFNENESAFLYCETSEQIKLLHFRKTRLFSINTK